MPSLGDSPGVPVSLRFETWIPGGWELPSFCITNQEDVAWAASVHLSLHVGSTHLRLNSRSEGSRAERWRVRRVHGPCVSWGVQPCLRHPHPELLSCRSLEHPVFALAGLSHIIFLGLAMGRVHINMPGRDWEITDRGWMGLCVCVCVCVCVWFLYFLRPGRIWVYLHVGEGNNKRANLKK